MGTMIGSPGWQVGGPTVRPWRWTVVPDVLWSALGAPTDEEPIDA